jgi:arylsulfatase A-like enzyme
MRASTAVAFGSTVFLACGQPRETSPARPNVVVVLIDTLRPDFLDAYGYPQPTAPFLREMARRSVVFEQAFSTSSWTVPSVASLFTSAYPNRHGVVEGLMAHAKRKASLRKKEHSTVTLNRLALDVPTLPERFQALGYSTYGIAANVNLGPELGFQRGFDSFYFGRGLSARHAYRILEKWKSEMDRSKPFLAYLHLNDVHSPFDEREPYYRPPSSADPRDAERAAYISEIGFVDEYLSQTAALFGDDENTVFVLLSDHGEEFWDHGGTFHGETLYREVTRVLMMVSGPARGIVPRRVNVHTSLIDVLPTLIDLAGGEPDGRWQGFSLRPLLENAPEAPALESKLRNRVLYAHLARRGSARHRWAAFDGNFYLIETRSGGLELYDATDLEQSVDLHPGSAERARGLVSGLAELKSDTGPAVSDTVEVGLDPELLETLRSLGYVER